MVIVASPLSPKNQSLKPWWVTLRYTSRNPLHFPDCSKIFLVALHRQVSPFKVGPFWAPFRPGHSLAAVGDGWEIAARQGEPHPGAGFVASSGGGWIFYLRWWCGWYMMVIVDSNQLSGWWWLEHDFYFSIYWEWSSKLTNIYWRGSNHQPVMDMIIVLVMIVNEEWLS